MHTGKQKAKPIGDDNMYNFELNPNISLGEFIIGDNIEKYLYLSHTVNHIDLGRYSYDTYAFYNGSVKIWITEDNKIETIRCDTKCYWKGQNLIGMLYDNFIILSNKSSDTENIGYLHIDTERKKKHQVYEFNKLGLQIWGYRKKIRAVLISRYDGIENYTLTPCKSVGKFILGDYIEKYLYLNHLISYSDKETFFYNSYSFYNEAITIWTTEDEKIETIRCDTKCYWKGQNLIGMLYSDFLIMSCQYPNTESTEYVLLDSNRGQNQKVYNFNDLGLMIWVWRSKIKTVLVSRYD